MKNTIYICKTKPEYPEYCDAYSPDEQFKEYPFQNINNKPNSVYRVMRMALFQMGYDRDHFDTSLWNPFGNIIRPGDTVLIKPNWVSHANNNKTAGVECLVTHTSIVRFVIDYCYIALRGKGKIVIGDAPIQGADFERILDRYHISDLIDFYHKQGVDIELKDLRNKEEVIYVNLGKKSKFYEIRNNQQYHVMDYLEEKTQSFHNGKRQVYAINRTALEANVILNIPKPKCHKLAGMTGALKNMVGTVSDKSTLPHERIGTGSNNGDSTNKESGLGSIVHYLRHQAEKAYEKGNNRQGKLYRRFDSLIRKAYGIFDKELFLFGGWYGNDTIWRTIHDLNFILIHYDNKGEYHELPQRRIFSIADMIIAGENEGPLAPSPIKTGLLLFSDNSEVMDVAISRLMGFDAERIPTLANLSALNEIYKTTVKSNDDVLNGSSIEKISSRQPFLAQSGWRGHIER